MRTLAGSSRKKIRINMTVDQSTWVSCKKYVPAGKRSDFVDKAIMSALAFERRKRAGEKILEIAQKRPLHLTTKQVIELKNYGRK